MALSHADTARLVQLLEDAGSRHSLRFLAASIAMHGLCASGIAGSHTAAKMASVAYDLGDAFLEETVARLLPEGL